VSLERQVLFWGLGLAALLLIVFLLGSTITPFAAGIALGYLLDPIVIKLQRFGFNRLGASLLILTVFVITLVLFFILVVPVLGNQFIALAQHLPAYAVRLQAFAVAEGNALIAKYGGQWLETFGINQPLSSAQIQKSVGDFVAQSAQWLLDTFRQLVSGGAALFSFLSLLIVTPVVAFYILVDWNRMIAKLDSWLPLDHRDSLRKIAREINHALAGFIRGQSLVCLFLAVWYSIGLTLIGLDYGFLIGVVGGVLSFVPYLGSLTALMLSLSVALFQGWPSLKLFLLALAIVGTGQLLEGNVLSPKLVGESIGVHPVWLMFALLAFGQLFGFVGLLIAVPTAAAIGVVARHLIALYLTSPFYRGSEPERR
jgi:predicted PurR-regulated permease PerM